MPWFLKISQSNWLRTESTAPAPADALKDFKTEGNRLSIWLVEEDRSNLRLIITALAANRDLVANLDFALMPTDAVRRLGLTIEESDGHTPVQSVNRWHRDLAQLHAHDVANLAEAFIGDKARTPERDVRTMLCDAIARGLLDSANLSIHIQEHLRKRNLLP